MVQLDQLVTAFQILLSDLISKEIITTEENSRISEVLNDDE